MRWGGQTTTASAQILNDEPVCLCEDGLDRMLDFELHSSSGFPFMLEKDLCRGKIRALRSGAGEFWGQLDDRLRLRCAANWVGLEGRRNQLGLHNNTDCVRLGERRPWLEIGCKDNWFRSSTGWVGGL